jgi:hypothetical protein
MTLATYAGLQASIGPLIGRADTGTYVADWIALAEARIGRELRVDQMLARETATLSAEFGTVPTDFLAPKVMRLTTGCKSLLRYLTVDQMATLQQAQASGPVQAYARLRNEFWFYPPPSGSDQAELIYYAAIPALSSTNATNWLLTSHPDVYLRATMLEAALFYEDDALAQVYSPLFSDAISEVQGAAKRDALASSLSMSPSGLVV